MLAAALVLSILDPASAREPQPDSPDATVETIAVDDDAPAEAAAAITVLEPVVVTAGKRAQLQREVAGSIGALRGEALEAMGARTAEDYLKLVPGVALNKEAADRSDFPIRGIATETRFQTTQRATGVYIDDIPMSDPFIPISQPDLSPFDLERIEVLKGPQATLFGSTGLAGAVRYITRKPAPGQLQGTVSGSLARVVEGRSEPYAAAMLNLPVGGRAAVRGAAVRYEQPGYIDDVRSGARDIGATRQDQARLQGSWLALDDLVLTGTYLTQESRQDDLPYADQRERLEHGNALAPSPTRSDFEVGNLVVDYRFSWAQLTSATSVLSKAAQLRLESSRTLGALGSGAPLFNIADTQARGVTQELRLASAPDPGPWQWLAGAWFLRYESTYDQHLPAPVTSPVRGPPPGGEDSELAYGHFRSRGVELALFGDLGRQLGESWLVAAGGRLYRTELRSHNVTGGLLVTAAAGGTQVNDDELVEDGLNPRVSLTWRPLPHASFYGLVSKGFRFGGVQLTPPTDIGSAGTGIQNTYKSDTLWNYELGGRSDWLDRRLQLDLTLFHGRWKDLQITRVDNTGLFNFVQNIAAAHTQGAELGLQVQVLDAVRWSTAATYTDARTDERFQSASGQVPAGTRLPGTPRFQAATVVSCELPLAGWPLGVSLAHSRVGTSPNNLFGTEQLGGYDTLDLRAHLEMGGQPWRPRLALSVTNLTNSRGVAGAFADPSSSARDYYFITPRTVSLTTTLSF